MEESQRHHCTILKSQTFGYYGFLELHGLLFVPLYFYDFSYVNNSYLTGCLQVCSVKLREGDIPGVVLCYGELLFSGGIEVAYRWVHWGGQEKTK